ncbi:MAG: NAD(P)/FAD-dependent oxidoreductase [Proteobacteria bacterium]|nr:NAD(P)/FAD-dependent oxidoreductase [Pseudomonadota bacterium]
MYFANASHQVFDTVIFGSGLAGLSCARRLAVDGQKVAVLEKAKELGGHLLPFERSGATFEVGLHYIADMAGGSHFDRSLNSLGISLEKIPLDDEFETLVFDGSHSAESGDAENFSYCAPAGRFAERLKEHFPEQTGGIDRYFEYLDLVWSVSRQLSFPVAVRDVLKIAIAHKSRVKLVYLATKTLAQVFDSCRISGRLREILAVHHVLIGVPPSRVSAFLHMTVQRYYFEGAGFVRGGGRAMIRGLMHPQVTYRCNADATFEKIHSPELVRSGVRFCVRMADGVELYARNVVWTPDPRTLNQSARGISASAFLDIKLRGAETPHALVVGYYATRRPLQEYGLMNRNYWLMGSLDSEACYLNESLLKLAEASPLYLSTGSLRDPEAVEQGNKLGARGVFQAMFLCPPVAEIWGGESPDKYRLPESKGGYGRHYRVLKEDVLGKLTQRLIRQWPQLEGELVWTELGTPLTHRRYLNSQTLNGYGFAPTVSDLLWKRPSAWTGQDGLFLCGAHIRPSHGIVTALLNGVGLAEMISSCEH